MENKGEIDISFVIIIGTMGVLFLVFFIIFIVLLYQKRMLAGKTELANAEREHQKQLLEAVMDVTETERQKIATDLHDEVGLNLSILKINFSKLQSDNSEEGQNLLATSYALIEDSMDIVRGIHNNIRPPTLMSLGLVSAIKELAREINISGAAEVSVECKNDVKIADKNAELQYHRLIKEVLNNTLRHAKPAFIEINIENNENELRVIILHDGMSVTTKTLRELSKNSKGLGLKSIFTRLDLLKAQIDFSGENGKAVVVLKCKLV